MILALIETKVDSHTMHTSKSNKIYYKITNPNTPSSFNILLSEIQKFWLLLVTLSHLDIFKT